MIFDFYDQPAGLAWLTRLYNQCPYRGCSICMPVEHSPGRYTLWISDQCIHIDHRTKGQVLDALVALGIPAHDLYVQGDLDIPEPIQDHSLPGGVSPALAACRRCGEYEAGLEKLCIVKRTPLERALVACYELLDDSDVRYYIGHTKGNMHLLHAALNQARPLVTRIQTRD